MKIETSKTTLEMTNIFDEVLQQDWDYFEQKNISMTYQDRIITKILQLFNDKIDSAEDEIVNCLINFYADNEVSNGDAVQQIIKTIKLKVGINDN